MLRRSLSTRAASPAASANAHEVIVSGGGLVGGAMIASLQQLRSRLHAEGSKMNFTSSDRSATGTILSSQLARLMLVDSSARPAYDAANMMHTLRTVSITPVSSKILDNLGAWDRLTTKHPYYRMAVRHEQVNSPTLGSGARSSAFFMTSLLGNATSAEPLLEFTDLRKPVGFICFNTELNSCMIDVVEAQQKAAAETEGFHDTLCFNHRLEDVKLPSQGNMDGPWGTAKLVSGDAKADTEFGLILGCEGRGSPLRDVLSTPSLQHDYAQTAFVCDVRVEKVDDGNVCSFQNFFRDGKIIGMLPTSEETANIVFSTTPQHARELMACTHEELVAELNQRLCAFAPNDIPKILEVPQKTTADGSTKRAQGFFPLKLNVATTPYAPRAILLGDAAHSIHPFAGQGLNLGIYDICALTSVLEQAIRSGQDIGSSVAVGQVFAGHMLSHTAPMILGMEMIKKLTYGVPGLSSVGMKALNSLPLVSTVAKDAIMQVSSGAVFASQQKGSFLLQ
ncbi:putative mitochondrial Monooxygenase [Leptomonas pyrrhocoris]|uniref:Putative mitochondrial Monooxygenase n=1 Tax=Leptomonas pyrrhocoris TaxID=157538 RepID=A0A0M9G702_LEPPY|nr:putative mitochondrial Monooxygenase [Leptomonas pyrrhocoris]KPA83763.1 putative mitochondrial Monooxygenase [Leptomonas pyrrhocoris]|eukprot:XP_015662202.1 putative mitochondrial Monooxygenase [Leptomonas pyrrhocoris]